LLRRRARQGLERNVAHHHEAVLVLAADARTEREALLLVRMGNLRLALLRPWMRRRRMRRLRMRRLRMLRWRLRLRGLRMSRRRLRWRRRRGLGLCRLRLRFARGVLLPIVLRSRNRRRAEGECERDPDGRKVSHPNVRRYSGLPRKGTGACLSRIQWVAGGK